MVFALVGTIYCMQMAGNSSGSPYTVAFLQLDYREGEPAERRIERVLHYTNNAPEADLIVLPELWDVGYFSFDEFEASAKPLESGPVAELEKVARRRGCLIVAGSVLERQGSDLYNTITLLGAGGDVLGIYRKIHLFGYNSRETELLTPGLEIVVVETELGRVGLSTCFDLRFADQFAEMRKRGADLFVVPAAWPAVRRHTWEVLVQARAIENQTPIVACNGVGSVCGTEMAGSSLVVDTKGETLSAPGSAPGWQTAVIDPEVTNTWRREFPIERVTVG